MNRPEDRARVYVLSRFRRAEAEAEEKLHEPGPEPPRLSVYAVNVLLHDALKNLFAVAREHPDLNKWCEGTLDQAADALYEAARQRED